MVEVALEQPGRTVRTNAVNSTMNSAIIRRISDLVGLSTLIGNVTTVYGQPLRTVAKLRPGQSVVR